MRREIITADNVGEAVEKILDYLEDTNEAHGIYFDGWEGLGASAVLKAIAERLTLGNIASPGLKFEKIICIDCSIWKSRRSMQRKIAEELEIPWAKDNLDKQDEEDDFNGIDESSRSETKDVARAISNFLMGQRFLVIFRNGSDNEIDITSLGLPLSQLYKGNKMLWTFRGRFQLSPKTSDRVQNTDVFLCAQFQNQGLEELWWDLLCEESEEVAHGVKLDPTTVAKCWLYISKLNCYCIDRDIIDYDWNVHASNYWVCDGIINGGMNNQEWSDADIVHQAMRQEWENDPGLYYLMGNADHWISATYLISSNYGFLPVPAVPQTVSSFFLAAQQLDSEEQCTFENLKYFGMLKLDRASLLRNYNDMFQHSENLRVLKLSRCAFRFASPPFLCCRSLRFLGLDNCQDLNIDGGEEVQSWTCFQGLWVLDLRDTQWVLSQQMIDDMDNLRELNVKGANPRNISHVRRWQRNIHKLRLLFIKPTDSHSESAATTDAKDPLAFSFSQMGKMELLDLSGNTTMQAFPDLSKANNLKTVIIDCCVGLESVSTGSLPASLEAFSLVSEKPAQISEISLRGCSRLNNLLLRGLAKLEELDLSGTAVKTLDLNAMQAPQLKRLFLLGCQCLRAILFSGDGKPRLNEVQIGTTGVHLNTFRVDESFESHISVTDARLLRSLQLFARRMHYLLLSISSPTTDCSQDDIGIGQYAQPINGQLDGSAAAANKYNDILDRVAALPVVWHCPQLPLPPKPQGSCKVEIMSSRELQGSDNNFASFVDMADSLYVQDVVWSTSIPGSNWGWVKWCRVERCPNLEYVFTLDDDQRMVFCWLETLWATHLKSALYIWRKGSSLLNVNSFKLLQYVHLYSCPRLIHVLPLSSNLPRLETVEILYCDNLRQVFPLEAKGIATNGSTISFPQLRQIHLHELPKLQQICEGRIMFAPMLKTVKIKGCWSLRHLPAVARGCEWRPIVDCEKDWWDNLEWDAKEDGHDPSLYVPRHPRHYKKALPRGSVLR